MRVKEYESDFMKMIRSSSGSCEAFATAFARD
jgi:hypothetical protein